jgi:hypothetical protein
LTLVHAAGGKRYLPHGRRDFDVEYDEF